jgi:hypothetical protein
LSKVELPAICERLRNIASFIEFFLNDSVNLDECMSFEYEVTRKNLKRGAALASDDTTWNTTSENLAWHRWRPIYQVDKSLAFIIR